MATSTPLRVAPIIVPAEEVEAMAIDIQRQLSALPTIIDSPETCRRAKESLPVLKREEDRVVRLWAKAKAAAHAAHAEICSSERGQLGPIAEARTRLSRLIYGYEQELERARRDAERRASEDEQKRQQAAALEEAAALSSVAPEMAEQILEQALAAPAPSITLPSMRADVVGVSTTANWQFKFAGCASGLEWDKLPDEDRQRVMRLLPREYLRPDEKAIGKIVKALKGGTRIPGVEVFDAGTVRTRG